MMKKAIGLFGNMYFLAAAVFVVWMMFFDRNDLMSQYEYYSQRNKLREERDFYIRETEKVRKDLNELTTDRGKLEKFAREKYLMRKDNEDVYVIIPEKKDEDKSLF